MPDFVVVFTTTILLQQKFEIISFESSFDALFGKNIFLYSVDLFLELIELLH